MDNQEQEAQTPQQVEMDPQEALIKIIAEYVTPMYKSNQEQKMIIQRLSIEKDAEIKNLQLMALNKLDNRDKWYKGLVILACLIAMSVCAFIDKLQGLSPVIGVIIGLVLKTNSISEFLTGVKGSSQNK